MNDFSDHEGDDKLIIYRGLPKDTKRSELSGWKKFLKFFIPWLSEKRKLGEEYLEAKVRKEQAEAFKTYAEGVVQMETAKKIARESAKLEEDKLSVLNINQTTSEEINSTISALEEKLKMLSLLYGTRVLAEKASDNLAEKKTKRSRDYDNEVIQIINKKEKE